MRGTAAGNLRVSPSGRTVAPHPGGSPGNAGVTLKTGPDGRIILVNNSAKAATITADIAGYLPS